MSAPGSSNIPAPTLSRQNLEMSAPGANDSTVHLSATSPAEFSENNTFQLYTPMEITPEQGSVRCVSSSAPFYINGVKVWCATPLHIYDGEATKVKIEPLHYLSQGFVKGWNKLPDELKINVLRFNVVYHAPIDYFDSFHRDKKSVTSYSSHLRSTPVIAALSRSIYYSTNTFQLVEEHPSLIDVNAHGLFFAYPKSTVNSLIQSLEIFYRLTMPRRAMDQLVQGRCGFQNLRFSRIKIEYESRGSENRVRFFLNRIREPYRFGCKGALEFVAPFRNEPEEVWEDKAEALIERLQPWFIFGCSKIKRGIVAEAEEVEAEAIE